MNVCFRCEVIIMVSEEEMKRFEDNFLLIRKAVGWSAEEFGDRIGVTRQAINNLENKKNKLTKMMYSAMRYALDAEIQSHPDETEMLKVVLDAFVDHPEKYSDEQKEEIKNETKMFSSAMKNKDTSRKEVSKQWKKVLVSLGVISATAISAILIGTWRHKR